MYGLSCVELNLAAVIHQLFLYHSLTPLSLRLSEEYGTSSSVVPFRLYLPMCESLQTKQPSLSAGHFIPNLLTVVIRFTPCIYYMSLTDVVQVYCAMHCCCLHLLYQRQSISLFTTTAAACQTICEPISTARKQPCRILLDLHRLMRVHFLIQKFRLAISQEQTNSLECWFLVRIGTFSFIDLQCNLFTSFIGIYFIIQLCVVPIILFLISRSSKRYLLEAGHLLISFLQFHTICFTRRLNTPSS